MTHALLSGSSDHETGYIDEEDERDPALLAQLNKLGCLQGGGREEDAVVCDLRWKSDGAASV